MIIVKRSFREGLGERLGVYTPEMKKRLSELNDPVWVHAASVGEVKLLNKIPGFPSPDTVITCITYSGKKIAEKLFPETCIVLLPIDFIALIRKLKRIVGPSRVIIMETELWPGFIYSIRGVPIKILNGRLSEEKFSRYYRFRRAFKEIFGWVNVIYAKDKENFARYKKIGVSVNKLRIMGDMKYLFNVPEPDSADLRYLKSDHLILVCGSTHNKEEKILIDTYVRLKSKYRSISIVLSPRHLERLPGIEEMLQKSKLEYVLWSRKKDNVKPSEVILVDTMGELNKIYSLASIVFIGGSLVPIGGHNPVEAAIWKKPIVTGPHYANFREMMDLFIKKGGLKVAVNNENLYNIMDSLLGESLGLREMMGKINYSTAVKKKREVESSLGEIKDLI